ncbi:MAG: sulfatase/phosphatase domain-containing protein [Acidobacteriota bacterium]
MPDSPKVRSDLLDYALEVEYFDMHLRRMIRSLEARNDLDNTLVVVTGDNALSFPRCKANLYDLGTNVPLAIRWGDRIKVGRVVEDVVSLCDIAPTFMDVAGMTATNDMTGRNLLALLTSGKSGWIEPDRNHILTGRERVVEAQPAPSRARYPMRAIRTRDFLYIHNFKPDRYPAGIEGGAGSGRQFPFDEMSFAPFLDMNASPTKLYMMDHRDDPEVKPLFALAFGMRPAEEFYDLRKDPNQLKNVAGDPTYATVKSGLSNQLEAEMAATRDPHASSERDIVDNYWND